jgi:hypothetical protein
LDWHSLSVLVSETQRALDELAGPDMRNEALFLESLVVADDGTVDSQYGGGIERR